MSSTTSTTTTISRSTSAILFSSPKRRRTNIPVVASSALPEATTPSSVDIRPAEEHPAASITPTTVEIYRWTFTKAAVASCFVEDIFKMRESGTRDLEYFWLGRIPCRTVYVVGVVVGVQVWEKRTVYTVDDGTAVIDCSHAHAQAIPLSPVKPKTGETAPSKDPRKTAGPSLADYLPSTRTAITPSATIPKRTTKEPASPPTPVVRIGQTVRIVGRVIVRHGTRSLLVDEILLCASHNDEPAHWLVVSELHRTTYYPAEELPPFTPPLLLSTSSHNTLPYIPSHPWSPSKRTNAQHPEEPGTPASVRSSQASTNTSPSTIVSDSSPTSGTNDKSQQSPIRLRHPARLHTRDLTVHTLRIYVKHYMDNAPPPPRRRLSSSARSVSPSPFPRSSQTVRDAHKTPTKGPRGPTVIGTDETPRYSCLRSLSKIVPPSTTVETDSEDENEVPRECTEDDDQVYGYSLSHLRRVPELALLAKRIVHAESHRRVKEERKRTKATAGSNHTQNKAESMSSSASAKPENAPSSTSDPKAIAAATKRLFRQAIRTLFQDGSIVLWDGPVRPLPAPALDPLLPSSFASALWKANTNASTSVSASASSSRSLSKSSRSFPSYVEWDEDVSLSDPAPGEEAYIPLTPTYFSRVLERAISQIMKEACHTSSAAAGVTGSDTTPKPASRARPKLTSLIERMRAQEATSQSGVNAGPTAAELLAWLRNSDERWARVGLWSVEEALEWGRKEGRVWCVGKGQWEVCE
ncbi:hypothetical protein C8Q79DRAFT_1096396 [Trametes meyenii]|nr:hypothetical protein C8Q79DRAFT_1096396 [Trametes meyenii]